MAIKTIRGGNGNATLPSGFNAKIQSFDATIDLRMANTTGFGDNGWEVLEPTCLSLSGNIEGLLTFDALTTVPVPTAFIGATPDTTLAYGSIVLTFTTGCTWTFNANINNINVSRGSGCDGEGRVRYGFVHAGGGITQVWDETA